MKSIVILLFSILLIIQPSSGIDTDLSSQEKADQLLSQARQLIEEQPDKALDLLNEALKISEAGDFLQSKANALNYIGIVYYNEKDYSTAIQYFQRSLKVLFRLSDKEKVANMMKKIGLAYLNQQKYTKAIEYYSFALKIFDQINHLSRQAATHEEIGVIHRLAERYNDAIDEYTIAMEQYKKLGNKSGQAEVMHHQAKTYHEMGNLKEAIEYYKKTLEMYKRYLGNSGVAVVYNNYGRTLIEMKNYSKAQEILEKAEKESSDNNSLLYGHIAANYGAVLVYKSKYEVARKYLNKALELGKKFENKELQAQVYRMLYELNFRNNDTRQALTYYQNYIAVKDTVGAGVMKQFDKKQTDSKVDNLLIFLTVFGSLIIIALIVSLVIVIRQRDKAIEELKKLKEAKSE